MEAKHIICQNSFVYYQVYGAGKPVVLVHGFGEDGTVWQPQIDFLKEYFRLIVPDIPGSGQSEIIKDANIDTYAEVVKQIIDKEYPEGKTQVTLIGHSMGGYVTLAFAGKYSGCLNSIGLFHSTAFADPEEKKQTRRKAIDFIKTKGAFSFLKTSTPGLFTKSFAEKAPEKINALIEEGKKFSNEALVQYYEAMIERPDRTSVLKQMNTPVLFIIGENDIAIPLQSSLQQCYLPNQSYVTILEQSAHMGMWEESEKANKVLFNFLFNYF
ncbi:MAG: alpha/beta hydrolase [Ferruginibacter sp.]|uniref:alpha/beta fold hydrolase n=1 Tax=Ferruginibacter sp. TaxID=1940288 RepID=UPI002659ED04|nr:alpha/beta hydrolase [Ferruginibacter sp.]MDB5279970.1 alpha/beta hydrolase [Ferruginibacter sp.]